MFKLKKIFFFKTHPPYKGVENFNGGAKYEKTANFNFEQSFLNLKLQSTFK